MRDVHTEWEIVASVLVSSRIIYYLCCCPVKLWVSVMGLSLVMLQMSLVDTLGWAPRSTVTWCFRTRALPTAQIIA